MHDIKKELTKLESKYWQSMVNHDLDTALSLTDFPCMVAGPQGISAVDKNQFIEMFESHKEQIKEFKFTKNLEVRMLTPDTAVIAYTVCSTVHMDGKDKKMDAVDTSTWVRREGKWLCAMHTEVEAR